MGNDEQPAVHIPPPDDAFETDEGPDEELDWCDSGTDDGPAYETAQDDWPVESSELADEMDEWDVLDDEPTEEDWLLDDDDAAGQDWDQEPLTDDVGAFTGVTVGFRTRVDLPDLHLTFLPAECHTSRARSALSAPFEVLQEPSEAADRVRWTFCLAGETRQVLAESLASSPGEQANFETRIRLHGRTFALRLDLLSGRDPVVLLGRDILSQGFLVDVAGETD